MYDVDGSQWSQELQFTRQTQLLTTVFGAYYFKQKSDDIATVELNPPPPGVQRDSDNNKVDNKSWAVFTQWTLNLLEDRLGLTAGARYTEDDKGSYPDQFDYATPTVKQVPVQWYRATFTSFTPSGSVSYKISDGAMVYGSYSEGFKGGGWNSHFNSVLTPAQQAALQKFKPEEVKTAELGFKLDLAGRTMRLNGAVFTSDYKDMQITYRGPAPAGVAPFLTNAGKASIDGAELELTWAPTDAFTFDASVGYLDASIDELGIPPEAVISLDCRSATRRPTRRSGRPMPARRTRSIRVRSRSRRGSTVPTRRRRSSTPPIHPRSHSSRASRVLNASLLVGPTDGKWRLTLGVNNATDKEYPIAGNSSLTTGSGYAEIAYARPREYFALLNYDF